MKDALQLRHIAQVEGVARVVLWNDQQVFGLGADLLNGGLRSLYRQRQHLLRQVVPTTRKQIGINGRQFETRIADVDRRVDGRRVLHPLEAKPALDGGHGVKHALLEFVDGPVEGGD